MLPLSAAILIPPVLQSAKLGSTTTVLPTTHQKVNVGTVQGEHIHHHVYEEVVPVIEREVIQPTVIHTTIPIHERIEHEPTFHPATVQPKMTMEEFLRAGGTLEGRGGVREHFEGEPEVRENGGAQHTYPNAHVHGNQRPGVHRMASSSSDMLKEGDMHRRTGMNTPPIGTH